MRAISGTLKPSPLPRLQVSGTTIEPPPLRRKAADEKRLAKVAENHQWPLHDDIFQPPQITPKSLKPLWSDKQPVTLTHH